MNRALHADRRCFSLSPSEGERVGVRGPFARSGSGSQFMRQRERRLHMNLKMRSLMIRQLRIVRFMGAMRVFGRGILIMAPQSH